jgi:hypothetical protein
VLEVGTAVAVLDCVRSVASAIGLDVVVLAPCHGEIRPFRQRLGWPQCEVSQQCPCEVGQREIAGQLYVDVDAPAGKSNQRARPLDVAPSYTQVRHAHHKPRESHWHQHVAIPWERGHSADVGRSIRVTGIAPTRPRRAPRMSPSSLMLGRPEERRRQIEECRCVTRL